MQKIDLSQPNIERLQLNSDRLEALARATIMSGDQADILAEKTKNFKEPTTLDEFYKFADDVIVFVGEILSDVGISSPHEKECCGNCGNGCGVPDEV